jgi:hypothetical protein
MSIDLNNVFICHGCEQDHYWDFLTGKAVDDTDIPKDISMPVAPCCNAVEKFGNDDDDSWCSSSSYNDEDYLSTEEEWKCSFY